MRLIAPWSLLAVVWLTIAVPSAASAGDHPPSADAIRAHMEFLADDLLEGRATGTAGYGIAAAYVASVFRALGLQPAGDEP